MKNGYLKAILIRILRRVEQLKGRFLGLKTRFDLINFLIEKNNYKKYLEIGVQHGYCLKKIKCQSKTGVDPNPLVDYVENATIIKKTSDEFFENCNEKYDIVFIDGLHTFEQSYKDFLNASKILNANGTIVIHDCNPINEENSLSFDEGGKCNGDVFKTIISINSTGNYLVQTVDIDQGCGVIKLAPSNKKFDYQLNYEWFDQNRDQALNLISWKDFTSSYNQINRNIQST